jgi:hypothetical protein
VEKKKREKWVLVTTAHRGVFFGCLEKRTKRRVWLTNCRCAIYWRSPGGFLRLASDGPQPGDRIGSTADRVELADVTSVSDVSPGAAKAWLDAKVGQQ